MDKSSSSSQPQKPSTGRRVRKTPSTARPEILTPPASQSMVKPTIGTSQPPGTPVGNLYRKVIEDAMARFSPSGKMSEIFTQLADKFRENTEAPTPNPMELPTDLMTPVGTPTAQPLEEPAPISTTLHSRSSAAQDQNLGEGEEGVGEESDEAEDPEEEAVQEPVEENFSEQGREVVNVAEEGSDDDEETLDERTTRRNPRTQKKLDTEEPKSLLEEAVVFVAAKKEAAERRKKRKQVATSSTQRKSCQASKGVVIREPTEDPTVPPYSQAEGAGG